MGAKRLEGVARLLKVAWQTLAPLMAVVLFPVLTIGVLIVVVLGAVPIPWVRQVAVAVQRLVSTSVGDSFVLLSSPARGHAIITRVERDLRWLASRCRRIAVVGHPWQGAAIAHWTLHRVRHDQHKLAKLVTFGSGQTKLADLEALRDEAEQKPSAAWECGTRRPVCSLLRQPWYWPSTSSERVAPATLIRSGSGRCGSA